MTHRSNYRRELWDASEHTACTLTYILALNFNLKHTSVHIRQTLTRVQLHKRNENKPNAHTRSLSDRLVSFTCWCLKLGTVKCFKLTLLSDLLHLFVSASMLTYRLHNIYTVLLHRGPNVSFIYSHDPSVWEKNYIFIIWAALHEILGRKEK